MKWLMNIFIVILAILSILFTWLYFKRATIPYNSEGRFFDPDAGLVYHQQSTNVIAMVAIVLVILTVVIFIIRWKYQ